MTSFDQRRIEWHDQLLIGVTVVDDQHRKLVSLIASVSDRETPDDPSTMKAALDYAVTHFRDEEAEMRNSHYPAAGAHSDSHKRLTRTLLSYKKEFQAGRCDLYAFKHFMFTWVREHIMGEDMEFGRWLKEHPAAPNTPHPDSENLAQRH